MCQTERSCHSPPAERTRGRSLLKCRVSFRDGRRDREHRPGGSSCQPSESEAGILGESAQAQENRQRVEVMLSLRDNKLQAAQLKRLGCRVGEAGKNEVCC